MSREVNDGEMLTNIEVGREVLSKREGEEFLRVFK